MRNFFFIIVSILVFQSCIPLRIAPTIEDYKITEGVDEEQFFFSFYEVEIQDKSLNLAPLVVDVFINAALGQDDIQPIFSDKVDAVSREGNWYIAIEVYNDSENDCLQINSLSREIVLKYLRALKKEYFSTYNYNETLFRN